MRGKNFYLNTGAVTFAIFLQLAYYLNFHPFKYWGENVLQIFNDTCYIIISIMFIILKDHDGWNDAAVTAVSALIFVNLMLSTIFQTYMNIYRTIKLILTLPKKMKEFAKA